ncbi:hypothetical protein Peur_042825 [Populus x canadensis]
MVSRLGQATTHQIGLSQQRQRQKISPSPFCSRSRSRIQESRPSSTEQKRRLILIDWLVSRDIEKVKKDIVCHLKSIVIESLHCFHIAWICYS